MKISPLFVHVFVLLGVAFAAAFAAEAAEPAPERQDELIKLVRQECGSCHGLTLAGGLGPSLQADAMAAMPVDSMVASIMNGRPGTAMPGWSRFMTEVEAEWMVKELMAGFPEQTGARR